MSDPVDPYELGRSEYFNDDVTVVCAPYYHGTSDYKLFWQGYDDAMNDDWLSAHVKREVRHD